LEKIRGDGKGSSVGRHYMIEKERATGNSVCVVKGSKNCFMWGIKGGKKDPKAGPCRTNQKVKRELKIPAVCRFGSGTKNSFDFQSKQLKNSSGGTNNGRRPRRI